MGAKNCYFLVLFRCFASLSLHVILKFVPHTAASRCCNTQQHKTPRAQQAIHESSGAVRSRKAQCQPLPDNPETGDIYHTSSSREEAALCGEKIENRAAPKKRIQATQPPPPATRQQATQLLGGTCTRIMSAIAVAPAAACCSYCDKTNPPPPNEARAIRREGRRAISAQLAGRVWYVHTCHLI